MIRLATTDDLPQVVTWGARFHEAAQLGGAFSHATFWDFCEYLIREDNGAIFVASTGMIGGLKAPAFWDSTYHIARECFWWSEGAGGQALREAYERWASDADETRMAMLYGAQMRPHVVWRVLDRAGYEAAETEMVRKNGSRIDH